MTDEHDDETEHDDEVDAHEADDDNGQEQDQSTERDRVTSPMQDFSTSQVTTGFVVLLIGVAIAYLLPSLF